MKSTVLPQNVLRYMPKSERQRLGKAGRTDEEIAAKIEEVAEGKLHNHITNLLRQRGVRFIGHSRFGVKTTFTPDAPDFLFVWKDSWRLRQPIAIEAKADNKAPTIEQLRCHAEMREDGWLVYVVRTLQEVREILDK